MTILYTVGNIIYENVLLGYVMCLSYNVWCFVEKIVCTT